MAVTEQTWEEYSHTKSRELRNEIIKNSTGVIYYVIDNYIKGIPFGMDKGDLFQFGVCGLIDAVEKFDYTQGHKFKTFATYLIRGAIIDGIRSYGKSSGSPTRTSIEKMKQIEKAIKNLEIKLKRHPTHFEISDELGMSLKDYNKMLAKISSKTIISIDKMVGLDENMPTIEVIKNENGIIPEEALMKEGYKEWLAEEIEALPPKEKRVISLYYYEKLTLKEIGYILNRTEGRVSQLHTNAIARLRASLMEGE